MAVNLSEWESRARQWIEILVRLAGLREARVRVHRVRRVRAPDLDCGRFLAPSIAPCP